jgi:sugar phosphate permease
MRNDDAENTGDLPAPFNAERHGQSESLSASCTSPPLPPSRPTRVRWIVFALACVTSWLLYLHRYAWNFITPELRAQHGFTETQVQTLTACFGPTYGFGQVPSGMACDFFGPHLFVSVILVLWSLCLPLHGVVQGFYGLALVRLLFGAAQAGCYPALSKATQAWFPPASRTTVQAFVATFFGRGGAAMASIVMATLLMGACGLSWRWALVVMGTCGVAFSVVFWFWFRDAPADDPRVNDAERTLIAGHDHRPPPQRRAVLPWRLALANRSLRIFVVQQALNAGADMIYVSLMGQYFLKVRGIDLATAGLMASLPLWGGAVGGLIGGLCNDALIRGTGHRRWTRTGIGFTGSILACLLMLLVIHQTGAAAAAWALFAVKFFADWNQPTVWGTVTDLGGRYSGTVFGIINTAGTVGGVVAPIVFGQIVDAHTTWATVGGKQVAIAWDFGPLFATVSCMYVGSALCWLLIDCTRTLDRPG